MYEPACLGMVAPDYDPMGECPDSQVFVVGQRKKRYRHFLVQNDWLIGSACI